MNHTLHLGDCLGVLEFYPDNYFHSIVTDPPYGLSFMGKKWDYQVPSIEIWKECFRVLKPGGHLLSFSSARTYHRMVVNVEDAGFEIRDQIMWVYGSGFPKNHNVGKSVDKLLGNEREVVGTNPNHRKTDALYELGFQGGKGDGQLTKGNSEWEGWGTALKPAHEPIVLARKPISEKTIAANVLKWGTGAINIDKSRVGTEPVTINTFDNGAKPFGDAVGEPFTSRQSEGRFPANFIHDGSQEVLDLFPDNAGNGWKKNYGEENYKGMNYDSSTNQCAFGGGFTGDNTYCDSGSAARFFYCAKTGKKERGTDNNHPTVKPQALMTYLCGLITPPGGTILDPFMGSGSTGLAAVSNDFAFVGIELDKDYLEIATHRITNAGT
tara:strand:- start:131 stop:1273 length:1143 start_codon:yes stop_codon:yes gene_type:complete